MQSAPTTEIDDELHLIIGKTIRWWSMIEYTIDSSIRDFLNRPDTEDIDTSLKISLPNRVRLFKRLFNQAVNDTENREYFVRVMDQITGRQLTRDLLVHGFLSIDHKRPKTHVYLSRIHWEDPVRRDPVYKSRDELKKNQNEIGILAMALFMCTAGCHDPEWQPYFHKDLLQNLVP